MNRFDIFQMTETVSPAPVQELADRMKVRGSGILVAGWNGKKPEKPLGQPRQRSRELGTIQLWRRSRQELSHGLERLRDSHHVPLAGSRFWSRRVFILGYPNEAGPKATRSEIGVISRLALSEQSIL